jgi:Fur family ferric uptake transcriptional regulator
LLYDTRLGIFAVVRSSISTTSTTAGRHTSARKTVSGLIAQRDGHFTAAELLADAQARNIRVGRATVFRALDRLAEHGALERIDLPTGEHAYVSCEPREHHHHVVCRNCAKSVEVADSGLQSVVAEISARSGFQIEAHRLELYGLCTDCAGARP